MSAVPPAEEPFTATALRIQNLEHRVDALEEHHIDDIPPFLRARAAGDNVVDLHAKPGDLRWVDNVDELRAAGFMRNILGHHTTALEREILTWFWCHPDPYLGGSQFWRPIHAEAVQRFVKAGLLVDGMENGQPKVLPNRPALRSYMDALDAVPLPVQRWVVPKDPTT